MVAPEYPPEGKDVPVAWQESVVHQLREYRKAHYTMPVGEVARLYQVPLTLAATLLEKSAIPQN